jgi:bifunctional non-homologous end joining protein LigD
MMASKRSAGSLREYARKRDFASTPEPAAGDDERTRASRARKDSSTARRREASQARPTRFVVHEHHARRLHWDLRLEHDGVLESWAIPNGIPEDPQSNRKAIHVEDHPLSYIDYEGDIPAGNYGAGEVSIWDRGDYETEKREDGKLVVVFRGERLHGRYALFRTGKEERDWMIHRMDPPVEPRDPFPERLRPMLASPARLLPADDSGWAFEIKWDGVRAILYWQPGRLRIESRNLNEITARYPELRPLGNALGSREAVLDGEIVAFDDHGRPSFERLQRRMHLVSESAVRRLAHEQPVTYEIFDLLYLDGHLTTSLPYRRRRELLDGLALAGPTWQVPGIHEGDGEAFLRVTVEHGLEGVLAKRLDSPYRTGQRGGEWLKIKNVNRQELVIGGWLPGKGRRAGALGALLIGYYESDDGERRLRYGGRVGSGFDEAELRSLGRKLDRLARSSSPFAAVGVQPPREARFVEPELVAEIEFSHWTREGILRHPSYKGLRDDKPPQEVIKEVARAPHDSRSSARSASRARVPSDSTSSRRGRSSKGTRRSSPYEVVHETKRHVEIEVEGRRLRLSNRDKVLYPRAGFTKGDLIDYYAAIAPVLLGHLAGRPLTFKRYPNGVEAGHFYQKRCPSPRPEWVRTAPIWSERHRERIEYCLVEDLPTLIWAANLADIELHTSLSRAEDIERPTLLMFDLDPGAPAGLRECCKVALQVRELLQTLGLQTLVKTSGAKGLQVCMPLNSELTYAQTKPFAKAVAELLEKQHPKLVVSRMAKEARPGRVLIDWSQNDQHKTTVCVYSLRARERPTISTPLQWEEVERGARTRNPAKLALSLEPRELLERVQREGDGFATLLTLSQALPEL